MLYLTTLVKSQDGTPQTYTLGNRNLILGPNGGGKTAIRQSLELALDGAVSGLLGRELVKSADMLADLFPLGTNDRVVSVSVGAGPHPRTATWGQVWDKDTRKFKTPKRGGIAARFPLREVEAALAGDLTKADSSARRAFAVWACADVAVTEVAAEVEKHLAKPERAKWTDLWDAHSGKMRTGVEALVSILDYVRARKREVTSEVAGAQAAAQAAREAASVTPGLPYPYDLALVLLDRALAEGGDYCPVCGTGEAGAVTPAHLQGVVAWAQDGLRAAGIDPGAPGARPLVTGTDAAAPAATKANDVVAELEADAASYAKLLDALNEALESLLRKCLAPFAAKAAKYLPAGWQLSFRVDEGLRVGLVREDNRFDTALSGIEAEVVKCALAAAIVEDFDGLVVLVPGDRMWDAVTLGKFLHAIDKVPERHIVLVESTIHPTGGVPGGWTCVLLGSAADELRIRIEADGGGVPFIAGGVQSYADTDTDTDTRADTRTDGNHSSSSVLVVTPANGAVLTPTTAVPWTLVNIRSYATDNGRRALKNLYKTLVGRAAKGEWNDAQTVEALAKHLGVWVEPATATEAPTAPLAATAPQKPAPVKPLPPAKPLTPPPPKPANRPLNPAQVRILRSLGYTEVEVARMSPEDARGILADGIIAPR